MRLVYLHQYFNTPDMAGGTRSYEMARRLVARGHEVHMITADCAGGGHSGRWHTTDAAGIRVHWLPVPYSNKMSFRDRIRAFAEFAWRAGYKAASFDCDVMFATSTPLTIAIPAVRAARRRKVPMVFEVRDLWPELPIAVGALSNPWLIQMARKLETYAYSNSSHVVALSPGMRDGVVRRGYPAEHTTVIPNSADLDFFHVEQEQVDACRSSLSWLDGRRLVVYTGTLGKVNGVGYLARVAAGVRDALPDVCFLVVGDGVERDQVEALALNLNVLNRNFFMQRQLPKTEIPGILGVATLAVTLLIDLPELRSPSPNKFFDALAAGRPVAVNYEGWQADLVRSNRLGVVLPPDPADASSVLVNALANEGELLDMGRRARVVAESQFSRDTLALQLERILLNAVDRGPSRDMC